MSTKKVIAVLLSTALLGGLSACSGSDSKEAEGEKIRIGSTDSSKKAWQVFQDKAKEAGLPLEVVDFSDYSTPNQALDQGQLDVNQFQHLKFLASYNSSANATLTPIGSTEIVPLALFWKDHDSLDGIEGQEVVIPNDPTNQGRAINVLVQAKLLELRTPGLVTPTPADVDTDKSKVKITPVDAAQTTAAYGEGKPAIINNSFLDRAQIDPKSAVFADDPSSTEAEPYINVFVTRAEDKDNERYKKLVEIWHDQAVQDAVAEDSRGTSVPVDRPAEDLQKILERLEADLKK